MLTSIAIFKDNIPMKRSIFSTNRTLLKHLYPFAWGFLFAAGLCLMPAGRDARADSQAWQSLPTRHAILQYQSGRDLEHFRKGISHSAGIPDGLIGVPGGSAAKTLLADKVDTLFERVQDILDMHKDMPMIRIRIYPGAEALQAARPGRANSPADIRAWYQPEEHTIYLQCDDITAGMLAHEMAHAVLDDFLLVRLPPASAEILARHVDAQISAK